MKTTDQAVQLTDRIFISWLRDIPSLDATFSSCVYIFCWIRDGYRANDFSMIQRVDLASVARNSWPDQGICGKGHGLHGTISGHVKWVGSAKEYCKCYLRLSLFLKADLLLESTIILNQVFQQTHGFPPAMPAESGPTGGALIWGCGSNPMGNPGGPRGYPGAAAAAAA